MKLHALMEEFSGRCFVNVTEAKITEDGFDFVYDSGTYDSLIHDFIEHINKEKLVDIDIEDFVQVYSVGCWHRKRQVHYPFLRPLLL